MMKIPTTIQYLSVALFAFMMIAAPTTSSSLVLKGKRVLVTGAGRGIGRAIALICQGQGAQVAIASRTPTQLDETMSLSSSQDQFMKFTCDVTDPVQVESMIQKIVDQWGGLDVLINNAGGAQSTKGPVDSLQSSEELSQLLQLNVVAVHIVTSAVLRLAMPRNGHILNISSKAGKVGLPNMSFYVASKFALEGMTSTWAKELEARDIVVNSLSPGMVDTQSFPKPPGKPGVRSAESIEDALLLALTAPLKYSGHYIHVDELDMVRKCELPDWVAWKKIDEEPMEEFLPPADF